MANLVTLMLCLLPIVAVFGAVYSSKRVYKIVDEILNRVFEKFD